jgi:hypothetical protein
MDPAMEVDLEATTEATALTADTTADTIRTSGLESISSSFFPTFTNLRGQFNKPFYNCTIYALATSTCFVTDVSYSRTLFIKLSSGISP